MNTINELIAELASEIVDAEDVSQSLLPPAAQKERLKNDITHSLDLHFERIKSGTSALLERLVKLIQFKHPYVDQNTFNTLLDKLCDETAQQPLTNQEITICMVAGLDLYQNKEYDLAADVFYLLTLFDTTSGILWKWRGNSEYFRNQFSDAYDAYNMAFSLDEKDIECLLFQARCLHQQDRQQDAVKVVQQALEFIAKDPELASWFDQATAVLNELKSM